jgi:hypothetical protein
LFLEDAHHKETIRCYTKILKADNKVAQVTQANRKLFTSQPTDIYKTQLQFDREQNSIMQKAKQARQALRDQKKKEREIRKQQLHTNQTKEEEEAIVNP